MIYAVINSTTGLIINKIEGSALWDSPTKTAFAEANGGDSLIDDTNNEGYIGSYYISGVFKSDRPFDSWTWDGSDWQPPVSYPTDGRSYSWDESNTQWVLDGSPYYEIDHTYSFNLESNSTYFIDTSTSAVSLTINDSPSINDEINLFDVASNAATNNITISPNGLKFEGSVQDFIMDLDGQSSRIVYTGTSFGWAVVA